MTAKEYVRRKHPNSGAQLSAMHGWQIMDYTDQHSPVLLGKARRSESDAWGNASRRLLRRMDRTTEIQRETK
jgi:hypothetical protein